MLQWLSKNTFVKTATILGFILVAVFLVFSSASAQSVADPNSQLMQGVKIIEQPLGLPALDIRLIIARIIKIALGFVGIIMVVLMMYSGYLWMTAGGNDEQISQAKNIIRNAVIGLAIILSAYSIVSYVMKILGVDGTSGTTSTTVSTPTQQNFTGSGGLGKVIKDHFPARNQKDVPRNTKIIITFNKPVLLSSFVEDSNGTGVLGDCKNLSNTNFNWYNDCDRVVSTTGKLSDKFINVTQIEKKESVQALVVTATSTVVNGVFGVYTIVLKPITNTVDKNGGYLGNPTSDTAYSVRLGEGILSDDSANGNPSIFQSKNIGNNFYYWDFTCSSLLDTTPPYVVSVFPNSVNADPGGEPKNSVIQISFNEPMDPTDMQGVFSQTTVGSKTYNILTGNKIFSMAESSTVPMGSFVLTNNYQTLEFTPSKECGKNACGNPIYCLPVCDKPGLTCKSDNYQVLLTAAKTLANSFESVPFSGLADASGNALDGNHDGVAQTATSTLPVFENWKQPDNYFWTFKLTDEIDKTSPYINKITPGVKAQNVLKDADLTIVFSKQMRTQSAYEIKIQEFPAQEIPLWTVPFVHLDYQTFDIHHGPFLDITKQVYMPIVSSTVEDVHFNCFYPGIGPKDLEANGLDSKVCDLSDPVLKANCCDTKDLAGSEFCCNGVVMDTKNGIQSCSDISKKL